jgi:hypothetical protein
MFKGIIRMKACGILYRTIINMFYGEFEVNGIELLYVMV